MKYIGFEREEEAEAWARKELNRNASPEFFRAVSAIDGNGDFVCVVVMTNFTNRNVDLNIVMNCKKMRPKGTVTMFNAVFKFLFDTLRLPRVTGLVRGDNEKSKKAVEKFGFKLEGVMRKAYDDSNDLHIYGFLAEEFRAHAWCRG